MDDMKIREFKLAEGVENKIALKHHVLPVEIKQLFTDKPKYRFLERGERKDEDIYIAWGQTETGRYLAVIFIYKGKERALVISARNMVIRERRQYGQK